MREYFYYLRDENKHPRITVCLMQIPDPEVPGEFVYSRGMALCSYSEKKIDKKFGKRLAHKRAFHALMVQEDTMPIRNEGIPFLDDMPLWIDPKSQYNVALTDFEEKLLR